MMQPSHIPIDVNMLLEVKARFKVGHLIHNYMKLRTWILLYSSCQLYRKGGCKLNSTSEKVGVFHTKHKNRFIFFLNILAKNKCLLLLSVLKLSIMLRSQLK